MNRNRVGDILFRIGQGGFAVSARNFDTTPFAPFAPGGGAHLHHAFARLSEASVLGSVVTARDATAIRFALTSGKALRSRVGGGSRSSQQNAGPH